MTTMVRDLRDDFAKALCRQFMNGIRAQQATLDGSLDIPQAEFYGESLGAFTELQGVAWRAIEALSSRRSTT